MRYRVLGRTGWKVSELGLGGHEYRRWLPGERDMEEFLKTQPQRNRLVERALEAGVNYFDTTFAEEAESLGLALKALGRRRDVYVSAMIVGLFKKMEENPPARWREIILEGVEERLRSLQTDYIDVFRICMPENDYSREKLEFTLKTLEEVKDQGKIRSIGVSSHEPRFLAELIRKYDRFDSVMVRYNYHLQEAREALFPLCKALDIGIVVMKPFAWPYYGIPFTRFGPVDLEKGCYTPAQTNLRWILNSPEVTTVVMGVNSLAELEENLATVTKKGEADEGLLKRYLQAAQSPQGKEKLRRILEDPAVDIRYYAKRALTGE